VADGWIPEEIDVRTASVARMYDYYLGGGHNLEVDRVAAERAIAIMPDIVTVARSNRAFLQRAIRAILDLGVRQFLDLGSGIPTVGHIHEIALAIDPASRVAYVDTDPVAVAHTRRLLAGVSGVSVTRADLTDPPSVLLAPGVAELLDFGDPIAVVAAAVMHFVPDERDPQGILNAYRDATVPGSMLVFSHGANDPNRPVNMDALKDHYQHNTSHALQRRTEAQIAALLDGWQLLAPGLVDANTWRPNNPTLVPDRAGMLSAVASH
jgi:SAM-dependent methyltransferase